MAMLATVLPSALQAQDNSTNYSPGKPRVHISVHKQVDKNGNIISYDSVYSYSYSSDQPDTAMMNSMNSMMNNGMMPMQFTPPGFGGTPGFNNDFFFQGNVPNMEDMEKMMDREMQRMMQNAGMPGIQQFYQPPAPVLKAPKCRPQKTKCHPKKAAPSHNVAEKGVQI